MKCQEVFWKMSLFPALGGFVIFLNFHLNLLYNQEKDTIWRLKEGIGGIFCSENGFNN